MGLPPIIVFFNLCYILFSATPQPCSADMYSLTPNQTLTDGQTLVSSNQRFELGFFNPGSKNTSNRFLGIWYKNLPLTVVWVANRDRPISGFSGFLTMGSNGSLSLFADPAQEAPVWSVVGPTSIGPVLKLLGNGNLVLVEVDNGGGGFIWESFDFITDNLLPEMKLGWDLKKGLVWNVTSWKSADDPSAGEFTFCLEPPEAPQLVLTTATGRKLYRWGPWDGVRFSGSARLKANTVFTPRFNTSRDEIFYSFVVTDPAVLSRFVVTHQGSIQYLTWSAGGGAWVTMVALERDDCKYATCGVYGVCFTEDPNCACLEGFAARSPESWNVFDWTGGCARRRGLDCDGGDGFLRFKDLKLPDNAHLVTNMNLSLSFEECQERCLKNCSCMGFTRIDVHGNGGDCLMWFDDLIDLRNFPVEGDEIFIRMARAEIESIADGKRKQRQKAIVIIVMSIVFGILVFGVTCWFVFCKRKRNLRARTMKNNPYATMERETDDLELPLLSLATISAATNNFASENKIGEGGFGPVYKGVLPNRQEIAVKRLSKNSGQGLREFKNEVILIAKLQHRNLVKLVGCCIEPDEKMLVYEYLPNKSLDCFLFDQTRKTALTWKNHVDIVMGIARGILYLHQDSRLRIIHRDLKASNVLLDVEMNPKISDFGIARSFGGEEQTEERTKSVIGTYGYMSPEYAMNGHFSTKSDVYSFGVIVLEIVTGKKNWGFYHPDHDLNLLGHAWKLWSEGKPLELKDPSIEKAFDANEVVRCIQVALLCVQQRVEDRPTMSSVVFMLGNESAVVAQPKEPGFVEASFMGMDTDSTGKNISTSELTFSTQGGR